MKPKRPWECFATSNSYILYKKVKINLKDDQLCSKIETNDRIPEFLLTFGNEKKALLDKFLAFPDASLFSICLCFSKHWGKSSWMSAELAGIKNLGWLTFILMFCKFQEDFISFSRQFTKNIANFTFILHRWFTKIAWLNIASKTNLENSKGEKKGKDIKSWWSDLYRIFWMVSQTQREKP